MTDAGYVGSVRSEHWIAFIDEAQRQLMLSRWPGSPFGMQSFSGEDVPPTPQLAKISALVIEDVFHLDRPGTRRLPSWLAGAVALKYLAIPHTYLAGLSAALLPAGLETLHILGGSRVRLPDGVVLPVLRRLLAHDACVEFAPSSLPSLRHLATRGADRPRVQKLLGRLHSLEFVECGPLSGPAVFHSLQASGVSCLSVYGGGAEGLGGVERLPNLTVLSLKKLPRLRDVVRLASCPNLTDVRIEWCPRLSDIRALADVSKLRRVAILNCSGLDAASAAALLTRKVEHVRVV